VRGLHSAMSGRHYGTPNDDVWVGPPTTSESDADEQLSLPFPES
jgi:hypothetical protein